MKAQLVAILLLSLTITGCKKPAQEPGAIRKAIVDYLAAKGMTEKMMDIDVKNVNFHGDEADALVAFHGKGTPDSSGFSTSYVLARKGSEWVVKGRKDTGENSHGAGMATPPGMGGGAMNPHGGASGGTITPEMMPPSAGDMKMPPGHPAVPKQ